MGLNESNDETNLTFGESPNMINWRITENRKLEKAFGYAELFDSIAAKSIQGIWNGTIGGTEFTIFACNGHVYEYDPLGNTDLGTLADDITSFFVFNDVLYIQNGTEYYKWTGTGSIATVTGYRPVEFIGCDPTTGTGTAFESSNLLNGLHEKTFTPDAGVTSAYVVSSTAITSVDAVYLNGVLQTLTTHYTVSLDPARVNWVTSPAGTTPDSVRILYTQGTGSRAEITNQHYNMSFGGARDSRVFMWGNDHKYYWSGLADGVPSAEYFPPENYNQTDQNGFKVTDIVMQYDRQIIFTNKPETYYSFYDTTTDGDGNVLASFPLFKLNSAKGMIAPNQTRVIDNDPFIINEGVYSLVGGTVRDERNMSYISKRVQPSLDLADLSTAITYDWEQMGEYWLCVGSTVWVYQYRVDAWFKLSLAHSPTCFVAIDGELYFGDTNGQIHKFSATQRKYNGTTISATWEMEFFDVDVEYLRKFTNRSYISLKPETRSWVDVYFETNKSQISDTPIEIFYSNLDFDDIDFDEFSFLANYNPQPFRCKTKAKKWTYFKLILKNEKPNFGALVLSINLLPRIGGFSK